MSQYRKRQGFSLIELMIVLLIVGVLATLATVTYRDLSQRVRRSEARATLFDLAMRQEHYRFNTKAYAKNVADLGIQTMTERGYYQISIPTATATAYTLRASANPDSSQFADRQCREFALENTGTRLATSDEGVDTRKLCWQ